MDHRTQITEVNKTEQSLEILPEEIQQQEELEQLQKNCPNQHNHETIRLSGSDDGCLDCGFYSK